MVEQNPQDGQSVEKISIPDLGEFTPEEIKEWKQGYLRQSDYTKKTQELAEEKKKLTQTQSPSTIPTSADTSVVVELERQVQKLSIENELSKLKSKYKDFNEVAVLDKAIELMNKGTPASAIDWDMIHKSQSAVDADVIRREIIEKLQAGGDVSSIIGGNDNPPNQPTLTLSQEEDRIRQKMGISLEDWMANR